MYPSTSQLKLNRKSTGVRHRRGVVLICVVVCLSVVTMMLGAMLKTTLLTQRQLRVERNLRQAEWLLQAGLERAAFRLAQEPDYQGETWQLDAAQIVGPDAGQVTIEVTREFPDDIATVRVVAQYPLDSPYAIQRSHTFALAATNAST